VIKAPVGRLSASVNDKVHALSEVPKGVGPLLRSAPMSPPTRRLNSVMCHQRAIHGEHQALIHISQKPTKIMPNHLLMRHIQTLGLMFEFLGLMFLKYRYIFFHG
jgi:hypothetical protein